MVPSLIGQDNRFFPEIEDYEKDLNKMPRATKLVVLNIFYFTSNDFSLYRFTEYQLIESNYPYCIIGEHLKSIDPIAEEYEIKRLKRLGWDPLEIGYELSQTGLYGLNPSKTVFRASYIDFNLIDKFGHAAQGKQIRGVFTHTDFTGSGVASIAYSYLVEKYVYLACDNLQTIKGATLWANSMRKRGLVEIYDTTENKFIEELGEDACGVNGFIPWDIGRMAAYRLNEWGTRKLNPIPFACKHIVNIVTERPLKNLKDS
ncbi:hypothetical protein SC206_18400 [Rouxiella sp. T17]|uniref:hypothetical protein n=1 Tax=Rouxiella sp. T17 TaxID=3085684 RepID=UPI002FCBAAD9